MGWDGMDSKRYSIGDFSAVISCATIGMTRHLSFVPYSPWVKLSDTIQVSVSI
jgi:hypothetical protein